MDGNRFDSLTRALGSGRSRRGVLKGLGGAALGIAGLSRVGRASAGGGNSACAQWCHANFSGSDAGHCTSDAAHGTGACYQCGPAAPAGNGQQLCGGVCLDTTQNVSDCGACGHVCAAVDACTPAVCSGGACNQTSSCTGFQTRGGGGVAGQCGCTPNCSSQTCGADDGCGGTCSGSAASNPTIAVTFTPTGNPSYCNVFVELSGFAGCTTYSSDYSIAGFGDQGSAGNYTTDYNGHDGPVEPFSFFNQDRQINFTIGGVSSGYVNIAC